MGRVPVTSRNMCCCCQGERWIGLCLKCFILPFFYQVRWRCYMVRFQICDCLGDGHWSELIQFFHFYWLHPLHFLIIIAYIPKGLIHTILSSSHMLFLFFVLFLLNIPYLLHLKHAKHLATLYFKLSLGTSPLLTLLNNQARRTTSTVAFKFHLER